MSTSFRRDSRILDSVGGGRIGVDNAMVSSEGEATGGEGAFVRPHARAMRIMARIVCTLQ